MPVGQEAAAPEKPAAAKVAPIVGVTGNGKISATLKRIADEYKRIFPDQTIRWVFHSATKPELSNIMSRSVEGYYMVDPKLFGDNPFIAPFVDEKNMVRLADLVLMGIPRAQQEANRAARQKQSDDQLGSVKENFESSMDTVTQGRHRAVARGAASLEEREHTFDIEQRSQE